MNIDEYISLLDGDFKTVWKFLTLKPKDIRRMRLMNVTRL